MKVTLEWNRNSLAQRQKRFEKAQTFVDKACVEKMNEFVPVAPSSKYKNAGMLRDSVEIAEPGKIIYTSPFAKHPYYDVMDHKKSDNPNAQRLWFEVMKGRYAEYIRRGVSKIVGKK